MSFTCPFCGLAPTQAGHLCQYCRKPLYPNRKQPPSAYNSPSTLPSQSGPRLNQIPQAPPRPPMNQMPPLPAQPMMHQMPPVPPQPMMNQMPPMPHQPMMNQGYQMPPQGMPNYAPQAPLYGRPAPYYQWQQKYTNVGGWLLFFCISLTIIVPLFQFVAVLADIGVAVKFSGAPLTQGILMFDAVLNMGVLAICIYAGVHLWEVKPNGVKLAKFALGAILIYGVISIPLTFLFVANLPSESSSYDIGTQVGTSMIRTFIYVGTWYSYLEKSVRVRQTFGFQN
jgi:hypothetical protein